MRKLILALVFMIMLAACEDTGSGTLLTTDPYIGGKEGLQMKFIDGMPPDYIFDNKGYGFGIGVQLDNVGEANVQPENAYVEIIGINPTDYGKGSQQDLIRRMTSPLSGAKKNSDGTISSGGREVVEFSDLNYQGDLHGNAGIKIRAELCYNYQTYTSTKLCIKKDLLRNVGNAKICEPNGEKNPANSAGPVHITSLKESPMGTDKIQISFVVQNVKEIPGLIFKKGTVCDDAVNNPDMNKVWVEVTSDINGVKPECSGLQEGTGRSQGYITLYGGEPRTVTCSIDLSSVDSIFEEILEIKLDYNYLQFIERPLEIRDVST